MELPILPLIADFGPADYTQHFTSLCTALHKTRVHFSSHVLRERPTARLLFARRHRDRKQWPYNIIGGYVTYLTFMFVRSRWWSDRCSRCSPQTKVSKPTQTLVYWFSFHRLLNARKYVKVLTSSLRDQACREINFYE